METRLSTANRRLSELLDTEPLSLSLGGGRSLHDPLWVWGILGGKDVGKSTLIDALAGAPVVDHGHRTGEGTFQPAAYLHESNQAALRIRLEGMAGWPVTFHADAPASLRGLVLIDLPDFDSTYDDHVEQVRTAAAVLDGIIWVTTPKKIGDLRGIHEIRRVLKSRTNFVYVVNKIDWLLGQSDGPPEAELDRLAAALRSQMTESGANGAGRRSFLISAKHRTAPNILDEIARCRALPDRRSLLVAAGALAGAAERVAGDFDALRETLTTVPTAEASVENKRANLAFQVRSQARTLLDHHRPAAALGRLDRHVGEKAIQEVVLRSFPRAYCEQLVGRLNSDKMLFAEWSAMLFKRRITHWALLGMIAWPLTMLGALFSAIRSLIPSGAAAASGDPFRFDGLTPEDRADAVLAGVRARLAGAERIRMELPERDVLVRQFRGEANALADALRDAVIEPFRRTRPSWFGRAARWIVPVFVLMWFPLAQPLLSAILAGVESGAGAASWRMIVDVLSAGHVLSGLLVSGLILIGLAGLVYSGAVRDALAAVDRLRDPGTAEMGSARPAWTLRQADAARAEARGSEALWEGSIVQETLVRSIAAAVTRPIDAVRAQLRELTEGLEALVGGRG